MAQTKIIGGGTVVPGVELGVDPTFQAGRVGIRPLDYQLGGQILGHYRAVGATLAIAPNSLSFLFSGRWGDASRFMVIHKLQMAMHVVTAVTAQVIAPVTLSIARTYTASETTNISSFLPSGNSGKARAPMGSTLLTQLGASSAAAGISGGTKTQDAFPVGAVLPLALSAVGTNSPFQEFIRENDPQKHPIILSPNEGFLVQWGANTLATGTIIATLAMEWAEVVTL